MSLCAIPPEILKKILDLVGLQYFPDDIGRLTISRAWYPVAYDVLSQHIQFKSPCPIDFAAVATSLDSRSPLRGITSINIRFEPREERHESGSTPSGSIQDWRDWNRVVNETLKTITEGVESNRKLQDLQVLMPLTPLPNFAPFVPIHLEQPQMLKLLTASEHLTCLRLDTSGIHCWKRTKRNSPQHPCKVINSMLPRLKKLWCRMRYMCEDLLDTSDNQPLVLEELCLNISFMTRREAHHDFNHKSYFRIPTRCFGTGTFTLKYRSLGTNLKATLSALADRLPDARMVRMVYYHKAPCAYTEISQLFEFDALANRIRCVGMKEDLTPNGLLKAFRWFDDDNEIPVTEEDLHKAFLDCMKSICSHKNRLASYRQTQTSGASISYGPQ